MARPLPLAAVAALFAALLAPVPAAGAATTTLAAETGNSSGTFKTTIFVTI